MKYEFENLEGFQEKVKELKVKEVGLKTQLFAKPVKVQLPSQMVKDAEGKDTIVPGKEVTANEITATLSLTAVGLRNEKLVGLAHVDTFEIPLFYQDSLPPQVVLTEKDSEAFNAALEQKKQDIIAAVEDPKQKVIVFLGSILATQHSSFRTGSV